MTVVLKEKIVVEIKLKFIYTYIVTITRTACQGEVIVDFLVKYDVRLQN